MSGTTFRITGSGCRCSILALGEPGPVLASLPQFPHLRNGDAETYPLIMRKKGADMYMQRTVCQVGGHAPVFYSQFRGPAFLGTLHRRCRVKLRGPVTPVSIVRRLTVGPERGFPHGQPGASWGGFRKC